MQVQHSMARPGPGPAHPENGVEQPWKFQGGRCQDTLLSSASPAASLVLRYQAGRERLGEGTVLLVTFCAKTAGRMADLGDDHCSFRWANPVDIA